MSIGAAALTADGVGSLAGFVNAVNVADNRSSNGFVSASGSEFGVDSSGAAGSVSK